MTILRVLIGTPGSFAGLIYEVSTNDDVSTFRRPCGSRHAVSRLAHIPPRSHPSSPSPASLTSLLAHIPPRPVPHPPGPRRILDRVATFRPFRARTWAKSGKSSGTGARPAGGCAAGGGVGRGARGAGGPGGRGRTVTGRSASAD